MSVRTASRPPVERVINAGFSGVDALATTLSALANAEGGVLILNAGSDAMRVHDAVHEATLHCAPPLILPLPEVNLRGEVSVRVPRGLPYLFAVGGRYFIRVGDTERDMTFQELRAAMITRGATADEEYLPPGASQLSITWPKVRDYAARNGLPHDRPQQLRDLLVRRGGGVMRDNEFRPTVAGLLLFGGQPEQFVRGARITAARFGGSQIADSFVKEDIGGTLPEQIQRAETFLHDHLRRDVQITRSMTRYERLEYPMEAVRELVVNAVCHRDYSITGDDIRLFLFADRLEVISPGRLPGPVTVDNIQDERFSRNPIIVQILSDLGFIERIGYGVDRVIALMESNGFPAPEFTETAGGFRAILRARTSVQPTIEEPVSSAYALSARQEQALRFLQAGNTRITNKDLQELFPDVHTETIRRDLADLVNKGLLVKMGEKRGSYYVKA